MNFPNRRAHTDQTLHTLSYTGEPVAHSLVAGPGNRQVN